MCGLNATAELKNACIASNGDLKPQFAYIRKLCVSIFISVCGLNDTAELKNACIASNGDLTPQFAYIRKLRSQREQTAKSSHAAEPSMLDIVGFYFLKKILKIWFSTPKIHNFF